MKICLKIILFTFSTTLWGLDFILPERIWKEKNSGNLIKIEEQKIFLGYENSEEWQECKYQIYAKKGNTFYLLIKNDSECRWKMYQKIVFHFSNKEFHIYLINQITEKKIFEPIK